MVTLLSLATSLLPPNAAVAQAAPPITHGIAAGDVSANRAVIWSRTDRETLMHVRLRGGKRERVRHGHTPVRRDHDFTGKLVFDGLVPDTAYRYTVWFGSAQSPGGTGAITGRFRTAPPADAPRAVRLGWGGDLGGQNVCRDLTEGYPIFRAVRLARLDFFIGLGDMIYADAPCTTKGRYGNAQHPLPDMATDLAGYWTRWKYARADHAFRDLLAHIPYLAVWDDHEVRNDFGPWNDTRGKPPYAPGVHLLPIGLEALLDYNPIFPSIETPFRLYRNVRWGKHVELFVLDTRQYRDANADVDRAKRPKTLLGREQASWLKAKLQASDATWKILVSSVTLAIPTGSTPEKGRDGWANGDQATGFERELLEILRFLRHEGMRNVVWLSTDVHFAEALYYRPFPDDPDFQMYEFISGPLNAGVFPNAALDDTLHPKRWFLSGPENPERITSFAEAKKWLNFGTLEVSADGALRVDVINALGQRIYTTGTIPARQASARESGGLGKTFPGTVRQSGFSAFKRAQSSGRSRSR